MRALSLISVALLLGADAAGQNEFMIYPERNGSAATYTTRTSNLLVEQLSEVPGNLFAGIGDDGTNCDVDGVYHWATDEDASTQEMFRIVLRRADQNGAPDTTAAGIIAQFGPLALPTGTGRLGWRIAVTFSSLAVPSSGTYFYGVELEPDAGWPTSDGHSVWEARYNPPMNRFVGENPRAGAPLHAWSNDGGVVSNHDWSWRMGVIVGSPVLNVGGLDPTNQKQLPVGSPNYGAGGLYPDITGSPRRDGIHLRVEDSRISTGTAFGIASVGLIQSPLSFPTVQGRLWVDIFALFFLPPVPMGGGTAIIPLVPPGVLLPTFRGLVVFQAVTVNNALPQQGTLSNAAGTLF